MIDLYAECAYGITAGDSDSAMLRGISRSALAPYIAWRLHCALGLDIDKNGLFARFLARLYQVAANVGLRMRQERFELPSGSDLAVDPGLKIYWLGRLLLERVAHAGPSYLEDSALAADVERFRSVFAAYFMKGPDTRMALRFGNFAADANPERRLGRLRQGT